MAVVETRTSKGAPRTTHVWFAEEAGTLWLEAGTPENPWYQDVLRDPRLVLSSDGEPRRFTAHPVPDEHRQRELRALLREKYGVRDWWVGLFVDASRSVPVRLAPE